MLKLFVKVALLFVSLTFTPHFSIAQSQLPFFDDAAIRAIQFVDAKEGWASGGSPSGRPLCCASSFFGALARGGAPARGALCARLGCAGGPLGHRRARL